jgi:hypothetical protein
VWSDLKTFFGLHDVEPRDWHIMQNVKDWWIERIHKNGQSRKAMASLAKSPCWSLGKFGRKEMSVSSKINQACLYHKSKRRWRYGVYGAKALSDVMPGE